MLYKYANCNLYQVLAQSRGITFINWSSSFLADTVFFMIIIINIKYVRMLGIHVRVLKTHFKGFVDLGISLACVLL